jgi:patatin-related protein
MAWNGGVSLAVWMGGAAVEFDCARRAKAGAETVREGDMGIERTVYAALLEAFDRRLVVDIITGASAGGLNGALLSAAMWHQKRLDPKFLRDQWLDLGDFSLLLQPGSESKPKSLMQGGVFYDGVMNMFAMLCSPKDGGGATELVGEQALKIGREEALLDVQVTTIEGEQRGFVDEWGHELVAREHRMPVKFRLKKDFDDAEALARAARASASFPAAFEPEEIIDGAARLAGFTDGRPRWALDGGLLENAPIRQAIDLIPLRPASGLVKRYLCYVNAAPPLRKPPTFDDKGPNLLQVLGHVVNLPRNGRFIDQLIAIEEASRRGLAAAETQRLLIKMDPDILAASAAGLLPAYQRRRSVLSLEELLAAPQKPADPQAVTTIMDRLEKARLQLPWIPARPEVTVDLEHWEWGVRAAQRALFLQLDLLRERLTGATTEQAKTIFSARSSVDASIAALEARRQVFTNEDAVARTTAELAERGDTTHHINALRDLVAASDAIVVDELRAGTRAFYGALREVDPSAARDLFGLSDGAPLPEAVSDKALERFLSRAMQIEVVRRSLADDQDIDAAQTLHFAQLTPRAPARVLSAAPLSYSGPNDPEQKLTGIKLGHFAGFYRRSWRANDYLWGRLDAATRIVDLIVDAERADFLGKHGYPNPAAKIAAVLVPDGASEADADLAWLAKEALEQAKQGAELVPDAVTSYLTGVEVPEDGNGLRRIVQGAVEKDLADKDGGHLSRVLCARAAQHEVLRQELSVLVKESAGDGKLGCFTPALQYVGTGRLKNAIEDLRKQYPPPVTPARKTLPPTLPQLLGRDLPDEATSNLAMRTISQSALVALAALPGVSMPLARAAEIARIPFLTIGGITARGIFEQAAVFIAFVASAFYLAGRLITAEPTVNADLGALWSPPVWAMWICLLLVAVCVALPVWRAHGSKSPGRPLRQWAWAVALALCGGLVAVIGAIWVLGFAKAVVAAGAFSPNKWVIAGVLFAAGLGTFAIRHLGKLGEPLLVVRGKVVERSHGTAALVMIASAVLIGFSAEHLWGGFSDDAWWRRVSAGLALASILVAAAFIFSGRVINIARARKQKPGAAQ